VWNLHAGINLGLEDSPFNSQDLLVEPRFNLSRHLGSGQRIHIASGLYSQSRTPRDYQAASFAFLEVDNIKSWQNSIAYVLKKNRYTWRVESFYQQLDDISLETNFRPQIPTFWQGRNFGFESSLRYTYPETGWLFWLNATWYYAQYQNELDDWVSTRYDGRYIFNGLLGKEWSKSDTKTHGVHARVNILGGFRETPIDVALSEQVGTTIFDSNALFADQQSDYIRVDLSIYRKVVHKKFTSTISLDIQNLTNRQNESFAFYDSFLGEVVRRNQLGLLPILNYRIQF